MLGVASGDIIDVRVIQQCTRGACPIIDGQTVPNIHYVRNASPPHANEIQEVEQPPEPPSRIALKLIDPRDHEMAFTIKVDSKMIHVLQAFATSVGKTVKDIRVMVDGDRVNGDDTPASVRT